MTLHWANQLLFLLVVLALPLSAQREHLATEHEGGSSKNVRVSREAGCWGPSEKDPRAFGSDKALAALLSSLDKRFQTADKKLSLDTFSVLDPIGAKDAKKLNEIRARIEGGEFTPEKEEGAEEEPKPVHFTAMAKEDLLDWSLYLHRAAQKADSSRRFYETSEPEKAATFADTRAQALRLKKLVDKRLSDAGMPMKGEEVPS